MTYRATFYLKTGTVVWLEVNEAGAKAVRQILDGGNDEVNVRDGVNCLMVRTKELAAYRIAPVASSQASEKEGDE